MKQIISYALTANTAVNLPTEMVMCELLIHSIKRYETVHNL